MAELEERIALWKRTLTAAVGGAADIVEELESHLREEIDQRVREGESPVAALLAAQACLGRPEDLAAEYARAVPTRSWLAIPLCFTPALLFFGWFVLAVFIPMVGNKPLLACHVAALVAGYAVAFAVGLLGLCYVVCWLVRPIGLGQRRTLARTQFIASAGVAGLLVLGMVLGAVWAHDDDGRAWRNEPREFLTLLPVLWFTVVAGLCWLVPRKQHLCVLLNIVGAAAGVWGWFGHVLFEPVVLVVRGIGPPSNAPIIALLAVCSIVLPAIALLGMLPAGHLRRRSA